MATEPREKMEEIISYLKPLVESYRLLVGSAEEFNKITLAHKKDLEKAIDRANELGEIIDKLLNFLDSEMSRGRGC